MAYEIQATRHSAKSLRKLPKHIKPEILKKIGDLENSPKLGLLLKGKYRAFRSLHIKLANVQYRVVYEIYEPKKKIYIHAIGKRQNFYRQLERMKIKSLKPA